MKARNHRILILVLGAGMACGPAMAQSTEPSGSSEAAPAARPTSPLAADETPASRQDPGIHKILDGLLRESVHEGVVDYTGLAGQRTQLQLYLKTLAGVDLDSLDRNARLAFWINAYNAFTLELILEHLGRIDSIKDISSSKRWNDERWPVSGRRYSLDEIEHEILRPMDEPRIHFALVCASFSCPDLRPEAYLPQILDEQLTEATRGFLANREKGLVTKMDSGFFGGETPTLYVSKIFDWFESDFEKTGGDVVDFIGKYAPKKATAFIARHRKDLDVEYFSYDWSLNGH